MRTATAGAAIAAALLTLVPGCGDGEVPPSAQPGASTAPASHAAPPSPTSPASSPPARGTSPPASSSSPAASSGPTARAGPPTSTGTSSPGDGPDRTGDLVRGRRTLHGTVERSGGWVLLRTDDSVWALLGRRGAALKAGAAATVVGIPATPPAGCPVDRALTVYRAH